MVPDFILEKTERERMKRKNNREILKKERRAATKEKNKGKERVRVSASA